METKLLEWDGLGRSARLGSCVAAPSRDGFSPGSDNFAGIVGVGKGVTAMGIR